MKRILFASILMLFCVLPMRAQSLPEQELIKVENDWGTAWAKSDAQFLDRLYATEYLWTGADGSTYNKVNGLKEDTSSAYGEKSFKLSDLKVHIYDKTGVVTGLNIVKFKTGGKAEQIDIRFTDVFVKRDGRWQCVATQGTKVVMK